LGTWRESGSRHQPGSPEPRPSPSSTSRGKHGTLANTWRDPGSGETSHGPQNHDPPPPRPPWKSRPPWIPGGTQGRETSQGPQNQDPPIPPRAWESRACLVGNGDGRGLALLGALEGGPRIRHACCQYRCGCNSHCPCPCTAAPPNTHTCYTKAYAPVTPHATTCYTRHNHHLRQAAPLIHAQPPVTPGKTAWHTKCNHLLRQAQPPVTPRATTCYTMCNHRSHKRKHLLYQAQHRLPSCDIGLQGFITHFACAAV
jgi:hypothetical protein